MGHARRAPDGPGGSLAGTRAGPGSTRGIRKTKRPGSGLREAMTTFHICRGTLAALALALGGAALAADPETPEAGWIKDSKGCKVANPSPRGGETVTWSGQCVRGFAQGKGVLEFKREGKLESRYEGEVDKGVISGQGKLLSADGSTYDGDWANGKPDGYGSYTAADGSVFVGGWTDGKQDGSGRLTLKDGKSITGVWRAGTYIGDP